MPHFPSKNSSFKFNLSKSTIPKSHSSTKRMSFRYYPNSPVSLPQTKRGKVSEKVRRSSSSDTTWLNDSFSSSKKSFLENINFNRNLPTDSVIQNPNRSNNLPKPLGSTAYRKIISRSIDYSQMRDPDTFNREIGTSCLASKMNRLFNANPQPTFDNTEKLGEFFFRKGKLPALTIKKKYPELKHVPKQRRRISNLLFDGQKKF